MHPTKKIKPFAGQQTTAAVFSASSPSALLLDSDQLAESASALPVPSSATTIYAATKMLFYFNFVCQADVKFV